MQQFNLDTWLQDKSRKVVTRDGREVRIICWDRNTTYWKIVGLVTSPDGSTENPFTYDVDGNESDGCLHDHRNDLFFADKEEELTEFEKEFEMMMVSFSNGNLGSDVIKEMPKQKLHNYARRLLDLARKELIEELSDDNFAIDFALNKGKQDALKDLPKWKKANKETDFEERVLIYEDDYICYDDHVYIDDYYIERNELKKLPKEE